MDDDAELAQAINTLASEDTTCVDNVAERFSELQVHALVAKADRAPEGQKAALLELGLGLFRLDALKAFIREDIAARLLVDPELDQVEASLYYLVTLAKELKLPGQPRSMTFARLGEVSKAKLDEARAHVKAAQTLEAQAWFLSEQEFWSKWLQAQEQNEAQFKAITDEYAARAGALVDQEGLTSEQYLERWTTLDARRNAELSRLRVLLTKEVLQARGEHAQGRTSEPER
jgi:C-terminal novel E3 ligase, LRR-interacting